jgi:hypothetical protein
MLSAALQEVSAAVQDAVPESAPVVVRSLAQQRLRCSDTFPNGGGCRAVQVRIVRLGPPAQWARSLNLPTLAAAGCTG